MGQTHCRTKACVITLSIGALLVVAVFNPTLFAQRLVLCDYSPPQSIFVDLGGTVNFRAINNPGQPGTIFNGTAKTDLVYLQDSPNLGITFDGNVNADFADGTRNSLNLSPSLKLYVAETDFFFFGGTDLQAIRSFWPGNISLLLGPGFGRFRNVTAFAKAVEIRTQLERLGKLVAPLEEEGLKEIATLIDQHVVDAPISDLIDVIQQALTRIDERRRRENRTPLLNGTLDASSLIAIQNVLQNSSATKFCGLETSLGLGINYDTQEQFLDFLWRFAFKYAVAPTSRSQLILDTKFSFSNLNFKQGTFFLDSQAVYVYRFSNALGIQGRYAFLRSSSNGKVPIDVQVLNLALSFKNISVGPIPGVGPISMNLMIDLDWSKSTGTLGWSRSINVNLGYEVF